MQQQRCLLTYLRCWCLMLWLQTGAWRKATRNWVLQGPGAGLPAGDWSLQASGGKRLSWYVYTLHRWLTILSVTCRSDVKVKGKAVPYSSEEFRRGVHLPLISHWARRWINHWSLWRMEVRDAWPVRRQTYCYLPSCRASSPFDWYQFILLGDSGTWVWTTCLRLLLDSAAAGN